MGTENQIDWQEAYHRLYLGKQFTLRREELGLDAGTVAEQAGYSISQYTLMEEGKRQISVDDYFRVADVWYAYEDAEYPPFHRKLRKAWRSVKRQFLLYELMIELVIPGAQALFNTIPLRVIVIFVLISGPLLMIVSNLMFSGEDRLTYHLGYALGTFYRMVADMLA